MARRSISTRSPFTAFPLISVFCEKLCRVRLAAMMFMASLTPLESLYKVEGTASRSG
ncbi:hypothetical protein [uncultured Jannaschia sp.]|uniref:hypothetical protein n=1 Tax=uncultured Jannaschia sp. TaxID=293347 RepID=UPI002633DECD|nr:hypothetical protein [uncultured Jannaschia sp.]